MVSDPYVDNVAQGATLAPRGDVKFLKTALREGKDGPIVPPDSDWLTWDGGADTTTVVVIEDPDNNPITADWVTTKLDPDDDDDVYDDTHDDYVGDPDDDGTDEHKGLFHNGSGHFALKVEVPSDAEVTNNDEDRNYTIKWFIRKGGNTVEKEETFNVTEAGTLVFQVATIQPAEVTHSLETEVSDSRIEDIIKTDTELWAKGNLKLYDVDPATDLDTLPDLIRLAMIKYTQAQVFDVDGQAMRRADRIREGDVSVSFSGNSSDESDQMKEEATQLLMKWLDERSDRRQPELNTARQGPQDGEFGRGRNPSL